MNYPIRILCLLILSVTSVSCISVVQITKESITAPNYDNWAATREAQNGIVRLYGEINAFSAYDLSSKLYILNKEEDIARIKIFINSDGGEAGAYRAIVNAINDISKPVDCIVIGNCYSSACAILQSATGRRMAYKNAHFMIHKAKIKDGVTGNVEAALQFEMSRYESIIREQSKLPDAWFPLSADYKFFDADFALSHGFIDEII